MDFSFEDRTIRAICESGDRARAHFGAEVTSVLHSRIADLRAADAISDVVVGNMQEVDCASGMVMSLDLVDGYRLLFSAGHVANPKLASGKVDWSKVSRIKILKVERYDA